MAQLPAGDVPLGDGVIRRLFRRPPADIDPSSWQQVLATVPWIAALDDARAQRLRKLAARFLRDKAITPIGGLALDDADRTTLAALCCLPLLEFGAEGLHGWSELLVYPDAFRVDRSHVDAAGVMHEWEDDLAGEAWEHGPLVLSWADVTADLASPRDGCCVAVHEMVHKLDALDGVLDGTPPLPRAWQREWARDFQQAYDGFVDRVDRGLHTRIDPYAAEAPEEFFAVCSEYHFSDPARLARELPTVAEHLLRLYGPSPFARA
ncbi:zinc-dependent peptidase [Luteimonas sp. Sa2BVA3]|uniref:Zinc-dependent peptidase n=1 Tax=Luteimonas colneyensis TaxID=2762230 RepID=A0ABR8UJD0_9GAMM|nr:M90 family metallopeptidase [Luteimonas colneyensis]MBD7988127.1 zinc-dependent peptidase [Luteimonas colneyensis]